MSMKVKPLVWSHRNDQPAYEVCADCPFGRYAIAPAGDHGYGWKQPRQNVWSDFLPTCDEAKAAAQSDYETRILSALAPQAGDNAEIKPSIDTMREAARDLVIKMGWKPGDQLSAHSVLGLMAEFGMRVYRGEVGCGYPDCGCCADAVCGDAIKQHPHFASHPCTSTPVVSQNAPDLEDKGGEGDTASPSSHLQGDSVFPSKEEIHHLAKLALEEMHREATTDPTKWIASYERIIMAYRRLALSKQQASDSKAWERANEAVKAANALQVEVDRLRSSPPGAGASDAHASLIERGQAFANQVRHITYKLHGQAYSSTVSALNQFDADLRRARAALIPSEQKGDAS